LTDCWFRSKSTFNPPKIATHLFQILESHRHPEFMSYIKKDRIKKN
jgi:hypothetical protein